MQRRSTGLGWGLVLALVALTPVAGQAEESITIVSSLPRTGSANAQTSCMENGIRLAIREAGGVVAGFRIDYQAWDDATPEKGNWDPKAEAANADNAIHDPNVMAYIGTYNSGAAKIAMPKLNAAGLVMISPANTATGLTKPGLGAPNEPMIYRPSGQVTYFRVVPADDIQGKAAARWAKDLGVTSAYVLNDREVYGQGIAKSFASHAKALGIRILGEEGIDGRASNYRSLMTTIRQRHPDLIYFGGTTQNNAGQLAKDMVAGEVDAKLMVPDGCYENAFITAAGAHTLDQRCFITFPGLPADQLTGKGKAFVDAYTAAYGSRPEAYASYAYEAARVVLDAIARAKVKDRAAILRAVAATKDFSGVLGTWSFDANGDTTLSTVSGNGVANGAFVFLKLLSGT